MKEEIKASSKQADSTMNLLMQNIDGLPLLRETLTQKFLKRGAPRDIFEAIEGLIRIEMLSEDKKVEKIAGVSPALSARLEEILPYINRLVGMSKSMVYTVDMASAALTSFGEVYTILDGEMYRIMFGAQKLQS